MMLVSATTNGAGGLPGCTNSPGAALRAVMRPVIGLGTTSVGSAHAIGDDAVDVGIGLAEDAHGVAPRAQIAFSRLMIGCRLVDIALRHRQRFMEFGEAREIARRQFQNAGRGDQSRFRLQQIGAVDGEEGLPLFHVIADRSEESR